MLTNSPHHIINYDMHQHSQKKDYILRLHSESKDVTHSINLEYYRIYLSPNVKKLHYIYDEYL